MKFKLTVQEHAGILTEAKRKMLTNDDATCVVLFDTETGEITMPSRQYPHDLQKAHELYSKATVCEI